MKIRVDYHFHPNLPNNDECARELCGKWWQEFKKKGIKCLIITEHIYKNPKRAYQLMAETKPEDCFCFPGMEYLTKENVDIVVFSNEPFYNYASLKPFKLTFNQFINFVSSKKSLYAFVTHPFTLGATSVIKYIGEKTYFESVNKLETVEIANSTFDTLYELLGIFPLNLIFRKKLEWIKRTKNLPKRYYPKKIRFLAAGSDAHHLGDLGTCFEINVSSLNEKNVFKAIISNKKGKLINPDNSKSIITLLRVMFTPLGEYLIKKRIKLCGR